MGPRQTVEADMDSDDDEPDSQEFHPIDLAMRLVVSFEKDSMQDILSEWLHSLLKGRTAVDEEIEQRVQEKTAELTKEIQSLLTALIRSYKTGKSVAVREIRTALYSIERLSEEDDDSENQQESDEESDQDDKEGNGGQNDDEEGSDGDEEGNNGDENGDERGNDVDGGYVLSSPVNLSSVQLAAFLS
ncbi:MAG: hypothetical protein Q9219_005568 [cf. Caloplaca sp. 3 TL-2023]